MIGMKRKGFGRRAIALIALMLGLLAVMPPAVMASADSMNYGRSPETDRVLTGSGLFERLYPDEAALTDGERAVLDAMSEAALRYNDSIPDHLIMRDYDGDSGLLTVRVAPYEYLASNGKAVRWIPASVSMNGGEAKALVGPNENGEYTAVYTDLWNSDDLRFDVSFAWCADIAAEDADRLLTSVYTVAGDALNQILAYEREKGLYDSEWAAYNSYLAAMDAYKKAVVARKAYDDAMEIYQPKKDAYDAYVIAKTAYENRLKEYDAYKKKKEEFENAEKAYYDYESFRAQYDSLYDRYEPFVKGLNAANARLAVMESMFLTESHGWQFYSGVLGNTVSSVLANSDELVNYLAVDPIYIDTAHNATEKLRPLLKGYAALRNAKYESEYEKTKALFAYYNEHYEAIRDQINRLYDALRAIYNHSGVSSAMNVHPLTKEKVPHFQQFMGQLYVLSHTLDDSKTWNDSWTVSINIATSLRALVEEKLLIADTNSASPAGVVLQEEEVKLPDTFLEPVEKPVKDFEDMEDPSILGGPKPVDNPGKAPTFVPKPGDEPKSVDKPTREAPVYPSLTAAEILAAEEKRAGKLPEREARGEDRTLVLTKTVSCVRSISNKKTVTFYDSDGNKISEVLVEYGASVTSPNMTREGDERYSSYVFLGWVPFGETDISNRVSLGSVKSDLSLVPVYQKTPRIYQITWVVGDNRVTESYIWGELPTCPLSTEKTGDGVTSYVFDGWSTPIAPVSGNATYTALYREEKAKYTVTWIIGTERLETVWSWGEMPTCPVIPEIAPGGVVYRFKGWDQTLRAVTANATYTAEFEAVKLGTYNNGVVCNATHTDTQIILYAEQSVLNFANASQYARTVGKELVICWENASIALSAEDLQALESAHCVKLELRVTLGEHGSRRMRLLCLNSIGTEVSFARSVSLELSHVPQSGGVLMLYSVNGDTLKEKELERFSGGTVKCRMEVGEELLLRVEHTLQYSDPTENSNLTALPKQAAAGETVSLIVNCTYGYEVTGAILSLSDGSEIEVGTSFVMPMGAVSVQLKVERIVYCVTFESDGVVISREYYYFGDNVLLPADPTKPEDELYTYTFAGWTPYVTRATGEDRNPVYTATFSRVPKSVQEFNPDEVEDKFFSVIVPLVCCCAVFLIGALVVCIRYRKPIGRALRKFFRSIGSGIRRAAKGTAHGISAFISNIRAYRKKRAEEKRIAEEQKRAEAEAKEREIEPLSNETADEPTESNESTDAVEITETEESAESEQTESEE